MADGLCMFLFMLLLFFFNVARVIWWMVVIVGVLMEMRYEEGVVV